MPSSDERWNARHLMHKVGVAIKYKQMSYGVARQHELLEPWMQGEGKYDILEIFRLASELKHGSLQDCIDRMYR